MNDIAGNQFTTDRKRDSFNYIIIWLMEDAYAIGFMGGWGFASN